MPKAEGLNLFRGKIKIAENEIIDQERILHRLLFNTSRADCSKKEYSKVLFYRFLFKKNQLSPTLITKILNASGLEVHKPAEWKLKPTK